MGKLREIPHQMRNDPATSAGQAPLWGNHLLVAKGRPSLGRHCGLVPQSRSNSFDGNPLDVGDKRLRNKSAMTLKGRNSLLTMEKRPFADKSNDEREKKTPLKRGRFLLVLRIWEQCHMPCSFNCLGYHSLGFGRIARNPARQYFATL